MAALRTDRRRSSLSPGDGGQRGGPTRGSVCFTGVDSLEVFIFFWGWKVFDGVKRVFGFKVIQECSDSGNGVPVPIPHWRWGWGGPSRRPGGWWGWLPTAGGLSRTMQSVGGWGRGGVTPPISQHGWWGRRGCKESKVSICTVAQRDLWQHPPALQRGQGHPHRQPQGWSRTGPGGHEPPSPAPQPRGRADPEPTKTAALLTLPSLPPKYSGRSCSSLG